LAGVPPGAGCVMLFSGAAMSSVNEVTITPSV
jgi:hypothetical protein